MTIAAADMFWAQLGATRLFSPRELGKLQSTIRQPSAQSVAQKLISCGLMTDWQASQVLEGCEESLVLGRYKLLDCLGIGSVGTVYRAKDLENGSEVALKVLKADALQDDQVAARFRREMKVVGQLVHPHIVLAIDAIIVDSRYGIVMEYLRGSDLEEWLRNRGRPSVAWACEVIRQAALGLQYAHEHGFVHRDIKPRNLFVSEGEEDGALKVKILDMGLARATSKEGTTLTRSGQVLGTLDYIAPEQVTNNVDIRADICSLGYTLFRMLTGQLPFQDVNAVNRFFTRSMRDIPPPSAIDSSVSAELDAIVVKMTARNPDERFSTPVEVVQAMTPYARTAARQAESRPESTADFDQAEAFYNDGVAHLLTRQLDQALEFFAEAIRLDPKLGKAYFARAKTYAALLEDDMRRAKELDPRSG